MVEQTPQPDSDDPRLPESLRRALGELDGPRIEVPAVIDERVLIEARRQLSSGRRGGKLRRIGPWAAAAAAIGLVAWLGTMPFRGKSETPALAADVDRNGRIDILDAFALARRIDRQESIDLRWDLDSDGTVDRRDVDAIGQKAVRLPAETGTGGRG